MEEQGLGVVVGVVGGGDDAVVEPVSHLVEPVVAQLPPGLLQSQTVRLCIIGHIDLDGMERDVPRLALSADKFRVRIGLGADAVVKVAGVQLKAQPCGLTGQKVEQAHGVHPAADAAQHRSPGGEHGVFLGQRHHPGQQFLFFTHRC